MHILNTKRGTYFIADTLINRKPTTDTLVDIARLAYDSVRFFAQDPRHCHGSPTPTSGRTTWAARNGIHEAIEILHEQYPEMLIDGEMQMNFALNNKLRDKTYPFNKLKGREVNTNRIPQPELGQLGLQTDARDGGSRVDWPDSDGIEQAYPLYRHRQLYARHRQPHHGSGTRCHCTWSVRTKTNSKREDRLCISHYSALRAVPPQGCRNHRGGPIDPQGAVEIDLSRKTQAEGLPLELGHDEVLLAAVPVFGGRVPAIAIERLKGITGHDTPAIPVVVYGNRDYDRCPARTEVGAGSRTASARLPGIACIAEHSIMHVYATAVPMPPTSRC